jgi:hypothetical protein
MTRTRDPDATIHETERASALATGKQLVIRVRGSARPLYITVIRRTAEGELCVQPWGTRRAPFWIGEASIVKASVVHGLTAERVAHIEKRQRREEESTP